MEPKGPATQQKTGPALVEVPIVADKTDKGWEKKQAQRNKVTACGHNRSVVQ